MDVESDIPLYDHDFFAIEEVAAKLHEKVGTRRDVEDYRREIIGRFEDIGLVVRTRVTVPADTPLGKPPEFVSFTISIVDRCERKPFDHERQAHEVKADILDLGEGGTIKGP